MPEEPDVLIIKPIIHEHSKIKNFAHLFWDEKNGTKINEVS